MVAKATTKSGEFFCFRCGERVQESDERCPGCGITFDRITESFRCPKCSNLLPVGAALCPSCGLKFKIRSVSSSPKMSEDDRFLMKLIDWGKQKEEPAGTGPASQQPVGREQVKRVHARGAVPAPSPAEQAVSAGARVARQPPRQEGRREATAVSATGDKADSSAIPDLQDTASRMTSMLETLKRRMESELDSSREIPRELREMLDQISARMSALESLGLRLGESKGMEVAGVRTREGAPAPSPTEDEAHGLSKQALRKLLDDRERELEELRKRDEELARREELLNRKIRAYVVKKKELEKKEKEISDRESSAASPRDGRDQRPFPMLDSKDSPETVKDDWLRAQSRMRMGLIEMKNEISPKRDSIDYIAPKVASETLEKMEVLEERLTDVTKERDELAEKVRDLEEMIGEIVVLLKTLDQLLGKLPPEAIDEFSKSKDFAIYEKVLDRLNV